MSRPGHAQKGPIEPFSRARSDHSQTIVARRESRSGSETVVGEMTRRAVPLSPGHGRESAPDGVRPGRSQAEDAGYRRSVPGLLPGVGSGTGAPASPALSSGVCAEFRVGGPCRCRGCRRPRAARRGPGCRRCRRRRCRGYRRSGRRSRGPWCSRSRRRHGRPPGERRCWPCPKPSGRTRPGPEPRPGRELRRLRCRPPRPFRRPVGDRRPGGARRRRGRRRGYHHLKPADVTPRKATSDGVQIQALGGRLTVEAEIRGQTYTVDLAEAI